MLIIIYKTWVPPRPFKMFPKGIGSVEKTCSYKNNNTILFNFKLRKSFLPNSKQNLTQTHCSRSFIFQPAKNRRGY